MAIIRGMDCMNCETKPARKDSHFCSDKCGEAFCKKMQGPVQCECMLESETVAEAKESGWRKIRTDPEGSSTNFTGICPECWKAGER